MGEVVGASSGIDVTAILPRPFSFRSAPAPALETHLLKLGFEKYFMWNSRNGYVRIP